MVWIGDVRVRRCRLLDRRVSIVGRVGSGDAVVVCGTLLAAYVQVVEYGLVFEVVMLYLLIKKLHLVSWRGCPTFGVQFKLEIGFSDDLFASSAVFHA